jgi:hypothetical protein
MLRRVSSHLFLRAITELAVTCCACGETQDIRNANTTKRIRLVLVALEPKLPRS